MRKKNNIFVIRSRHEGGISYAECNTNLRYKQKKTVLANEHLQSFCLRVSKYLFRQIGEGYIVHSVRRMNENPS